MSKKEISQLSLPNGCCCSQIAVTPRNWKQAKKVSGPWRIHFRFYDPSHDGPIQVTDKQMNKFKNVHERKEKTQFLIDTITQALKAGYNPFHKAIVNRSQARYDIEPKTLFIPALQKVLARIDIEPAYKKHIEKYVIPNIEKAAKALSYNMMFISEVKRKHIIFMLDHLRQVNKKFSDNTFNRFRTDLKILFTELVEVEAVESNIIKDIRVKQVETKERKILSPAERKFINELLLKKYQDFHRFLNIFFHSGARSSELLRIKLDDVELPNQRYKVTIRKGKKYRTVWRVIKNIALPYWTEIVQKAKPGDYLFSKRLLPGASPIQPYQIHKRWTRLIKNKEFEIEGKKTKIEATFYSLKFLNTTETVDLLNEQAAAEMNGHTSTAMVVKIYDTKQESRQAEKLKKVNNPFA